MPYSRPFIDQVSENNFPKSGQQNMKNIRQGKNWHHFNHCSSLWPKQGFIGCWRWQDCWRCRRRWGRDWLAGCPFFRPQWKPCACLLWWNPDQRPMGNDCGPLYWWVSFDALSTLAAWLARMFKTGRSFLLIECHEWCLHCSSVI